MISTFVWHWSWPLNDLNYGMTLTLEWPWHTILACMERMIVLYYIVNNINHKHNELLTLQLDLTAKIVFRNGTHAFTIVHHWNIHDGGGSNMVVQWLLIFIPFGMCKKTTLYSCQLYQGLPPLNLVHLINMHTQSSNSRPAIWSPEGVHVMFAWLKGGGGGIDWWSLSVCVCGGGLLVEVLNDR